MKNRWDEGPLLEEMKVLIANTLQLADRVDHVSRDTPLLGVLPELDSMAVVAVLTSLEEYYELEFEDAELSADVFQTWGSLTRFVAGKISDERD